MEQHQEPQMEISDRLRFVEPDRLERLRIRHSFSGEADGVKRTLHCIDRSTGKERWTFDVTNEGREDAYRGYITEHGYASSTPVTDGETVMPSSARWVSMQSISTESKNGNVPVGKESSNRQWGSAASPILLGDSVIVNAADESQAIVCLDKRTGKEKWKSAASGYELTYTPDSCGQAQRTGRCGAGRAMGFESEHRQMKWFAETK